MNTTVVSQKGSTGLTYTAAYLSVALAMTAYAIPGALNGTFTTQFHTSGAGLTWITAIFELGIVAFELTFGLLGDLFGRKRLLVGGSVLVVIGAVLSAIATTTGFMIFSQAVIGIGSGILFPIGLSMVAALTDDHAKRSKIIATWAGFLSLGAVISPVLSTQTQLHFTTDSFAGWRVTYWIIVAVALLLVAISFGTRDSSAPAGRHLDLPGQITFALGLIAALYATVTAVDSGFGDGKVIGGYVVGVVLLVAFVVVELRSPSPLLDLGLFANKDFSLGSVVAVIGMFAFLATCFSTSISVGALAQAPVWAVGVLFVFIQGPAFLLSPVVGWLIHHRSPRLVLTAGFAFIAAAAYWLSSFTLGVPESFGGPSWTAWIAPLLLLGIGFALTAGSITAVAINNVAPHQIGMASATTSVMRDLGFTLGPVIGSVVAFSIGASDFGAKIGGILTGAKLPADAVAGLSQVPPLGWLSGWDGVIGQFSGQVLASGAPQQAVDGLVAALNDPATKGAIQGAADASLGSGFGTVYLIAGIAATVCALLTLFIGRRVDVPVTDEEIAELVA
ncbi:MFS transporter [Nocardioides sp. Kera G14]|uniref:MFS transporter n=1 Tax=Nocardioides sp. Kera G14 TaxID=2884264 RepID=UPI001D0FC063|nr:MFS transporter [Nocardioides sp. Kera G14]UDY23393.1 MFS transporter [Nocardioides sp. Kera G14]